MLPSDQFYVDSLLKHRKGRRGGYEYLVKWKGHPLSAASWESARDISDSLIQGYHAGLRRLPRARSD